MPTNMNSTTDTPRTDACPHCGATDDCMCFSGELKQELAKSKAEVERLTKRPFGCMCETLREKVLGDGCEECNKALVIEMLTDERDELEAEVERLKKELSEWDYGTRAKREQERAEKAESEIKRLKSDKTHLITQCANLLEQVEKLQTFPEKLEIAIEIAKDALWHARIYENEMHFDKIDDLYKKLSNIQSTI